MASVSWNFDKNAINKAAREAVKEHVKKNLQPALDRVFQRCAGQPVEEVKKQLAAEWKRATGENLDKRKLDTWAEAIAGNTRVRLEAK
ncbi:hypothetical protein [Saccharothrix texasensis]|uniref:Uncharacterized protein n=1 Tax=Saccharothrix texasensis TaxID=103734 RepID=A0A3N1HCP6_9PSEU|nr:hypothetical protein [Saccharothrix texasensis]ROP40284.1 hypothetical protein EDD40_5692 [Saccharothrix texasensis]